MIKLVKSPVVFNEENHTYFLGEKQLRGITGMISRQLFPDKYKGVPDHVMRQPHPFTMRICRLDRIRA